MQVGDTVEYIPYRTVPSRLAGQVGIIASIPALSNRTYKTDYAYVRFWFDPSDTRLVHLKNLRLVKGTDDV